MQPTFLTWARVAVQLEAVRLVRGYAAPPRLAYHPGGETVSAPGGC